MMQKAKRLPAHEDKDDENKEEDEDEMLKRAIAMSGELQQRTRHVD